MISQAARRLHRAALCTLVLGAVASSAGARDDARLRFVGLDREAWAALLSEHTVAAPDTAGTRVDYAALAADARWRPFVEGLAERSPPREASARKAFWIDVYNVLAIDMVVRHWPVDSIRDVGSFFRPVWRVDAGAVAGRRVTLHEVEHEILRPMGDARIHMAIVCASTSCPSLARAPFSSGDVDARLDAAVGRFLADPRKGMRVERDAGRVRLSRIFDWFEEDFAPDGGVLGFVRAHLPNTTGLAQADVAWLRAEREVKVEHLPYDWRVNAKRPSTR